MQCLLHDNVPRWHDAHAKPRQQRIRLLTRTRAIHVRQLGILDLLWMTAMRSIMGSHGDDGVIMERNNSERQRKMILNIAANHVKTYKASGASSN